MRTRRSSSGWITTRRGDDVVQRTTRGAWRSRRGGGATRYTPLLQMAGLVAWMAATWWSRWRRAWWRGCGVEGKERGGAARSRQVGRSHPVENTGLGSTSHAGWAPKHPCILARGQIVTRESSPGKCLGTPRGLGLPKGPLGGQDTLQKCFEMFQFVSPDVA
jgi:hypothetical protein